jgi:hypothetical protein
MKNFVAKNTIFSGVTGRSEPSGNLAVVAFQQATQACPADNGALPGGGRLFGVIEPQIAHALGVVVWYCNSGHTKRTRVSISGLTHSVQKFQSKRLLYDSLIELTVFVITAGMCDTDDGTVLELERLRIVACNGTIFYLSPSIS